MKITVGQLKQLIRESVKDLIKEMDREPHQLNASDPKDAPKTTLMDKLGVDYTNPEEVNAMVEDMRKLGLDVSDPYNIDNLETLLAKKQAVNEAKKKLSDKQKVLAKKAFPKDELTAADFKAMGNKAKAMAKKEVKKPEAKKTDKK